MKKTLAAFIAGFLDGDGSIHVQLIRQQQYRFGFYVRMTVSFHQHETGRKGLEWLREQLKAGYIRDRSGHMSDYVITSRPVIRKLLLQLRPYVVFKKRQVEEALKLLDLMEEMKSPERFLAVARRVEIFASLNRSKRRKNGLQALLKTWSEMGRPIPVTTDSAVCVADEILAR